jgi:hypothetical protein
MGFFQHFAVLYLFEQLGLSVKKILVNRKWLLVSFALINFSTALSVFSSAPNLTKDPEIVRSNSASSLIPSGSNDKRRRELADSGGKKRKFVLLVAAKSLSYCPCCFKYFSRCLLATDLSTVPSKSEQNPDLCRGPLHNGQWQVTTVVEKVQNSQADPGLNITD